MVEANGSPEYDPTGTDWYYAVAEAVSIIFDIRLAEVEAAQLSDEAQEHQFVGKRLAELLEQARVDLVRTPRGRQAIPHMNAIMAAYMSLRYGL